MKELRVNKPYQVPQYSKLFFFVVIMMLIGIGVNSSVHAQEMVRETFTAGDTFNNLLVYDSGYAMADVDIVRDAVEHSMDTFSGLFNSPLAEVEVLVYINSGSFSEERGLGLRGSETWVQSQYDFSPDFTFFEAQGEHTFSVTDVCYIQVQDSFGIASHSRLKLLMKLRGVFSLLIFLTLIQAMEVPIDGSSKALQSG